MENVDYTQQTSGLKAVTKTLDELESADSKQGRKILLDIERRQEAWQQFAQPEREATAGSMAKLDANDLATIRDPDYKRFAASIMGDNMHGSVAYSESLNDEDKATIRAQAAIEQQIIEVKENRKSAQFETNEAVESGEQSSGDSPPAIIKARQQQQQRQRQELAQQQKQKQDVAARPEIEAAQEAPARQAATRSENGIESDELFATNNASTTENPDSIHVVNRKNIQPDRYIPESVGKKYDLIGDTLTSKRNPAASFVDRQDRLETKGNAKGVAEDMVLVAEARGWDDIKVRGSESFKREVYLEAAKRGMSVRGYTPTPEDIAKVKQLTKESPDGRTTRATTSTMPVEAQELRARTLETDMAQAFRDKPAAEAVKAFPELASSYAHQKVAERELEKQNISPEKAKVFMDRLNSNLVNAIEKGNVPKVEVTESVEKEFQNRKGKTSSRTKEIER